MHRRVARRARCATARRRRRRAVGAGLASRQPAVQRGHRADGQKRTSGTPSTRPRTRSSPSTSSTPSSPSCSGALPRRVPAPCGTHGPRADLVAILMTGIPAGIVPGFQNYTGPVQADLLRLNVAIPPSASRIDSGSSAATRPDTPTGGGSPTTSRRSRSVRLPV